MITTERDGVSVAVVVTCDRQGCVARVSGGSEREARRLALDAGWTVAWATGHRGRTMLRDACPRHGGG